MERGLTGQYNTALFQGERIQAFVPYPLPPDPYLEFDGALMRALEAATFAVGRLDAISTLLPDKDLFIYAYVRKPESTERIPRRWSDEG